MFFEELWRETEAARKDPFLVQIVRGSTSAEAAAKEAERLDYPTYLCRQAKLLRKIQESYQSVWASQIEHPQVALNWPRVHEYPCEWEVEHYHGEILTTNSGTLLVTKNKQEAAVLWDYTLLDEYGEEICHSKELGRDFFLREKIIKVNCHLNSGSRVLPRNGLTISFGFSMQLNFWRIIDTRKVNWTRSAYQQKGEKLGSYISRCVFGERRTEIHEIVVRPLSPNIITDTQLLFFVTNWKDPSALLLETTFLKHTKTGNQGFLCHCSTAYVFQGDVSGYVTNSSSCIQGVHKAYYFNNLCRSPLDVSFQILAKDELKQYEATYQPHEDSVEDVLSRIHAMTPASIDITELLVRMCDILRMDENIYCDGSGKSMLVKVE